MAIRVSQLQNQWSSQRAEFRSAGWGQARTANAPALPAGPCIRIKHAPQWCQQVGVGKRKMGIGSSVLPVTRSGFNIVTGFAMAIILALLLISGLQRPAMANPKFAAITVDAATGEIIYGHDIDQARYPASLTKVMTLYILFQEIQANRLRFDTRMKVSRHAAAQQPSKLGLRAGRTITVRDAMYALITKSANDASMVIAEHISGSQQAFAERMTKTARAMGMTRTRFTNPNGLPDRRQVTTARDMATLGLRVQRDFPKYYKFFATRKFKYGKRRYGNHNRLLGRVRGVDGIKTGYTRASGFNLLSSMEVNNRRIVAVVLGGKTGRSRNAFMTKILRRDIAKAIRSNNRIAAVAGKPKGYNPASAAKLVAMAKPVSPIKNPPVPRIKPDNLVPAAVASATVSATAPVTTEEMQKLAAKAEAATSAPKPKSVTQIALKALPANGVTFKSVTVAEGNSKGDSLIVANAAQALAPAPAAPGGKLQKRLSAASAAAVQPATTLAAAAPVKAPAGTNLVANPKEVKEKLALHQSSWNIQIGAFPTAEGAKSRINAAKSSRVSALRNATPFLMAIDKNGDTIYRARFSGLNRKQARNACRQLKRAGVGCFPLAPTS
jgi:D-alanyl-D-alanine carboxypeptidase